MYERRVTTKHFLFVPPFLWEEQLPTIELKGKKVAWLLALPISEEERRYVQKTGSESLEKLFEEREISWFDLNRASEV